MAEYWIRPSPAAGDGYGSNTGADADNAWGYNYYRSNFSSLGVVNNDTIYFLGLDENGNEKSFSALNAIRWTNTGLTFDGLPPGATRGAIFENANASQSFTTGDPLLDGKPNNTSGDVDGATFKNIWFRAPRAINNGTLVILGNINNITFDTCKFSGNGIEAYDIGNGQGVRITQYNYGNKSGTGGCGLITFTGCLFENFGSYAIEADYSGAALTAYRSPFRLIIENSEFRNCVRAINCTSNNESIFDTYFAAPGPGTLSNGMPHQVWIDGNRFINCSDWVIDHLWASVDDSGLRSGIVNNEFIDCGAFYTGESANIVQTHGNKKGQISNNRFIRWVAGDHNDGSAIILDFYDGTSADYACDGMDISGNYFLDGSTHPDRLAISGLTYLTMDQNDRNKAIGIWFGTNCRIARNTFDTCSVAIRHAPNARNSGHVIAFNTFRNNFIDILHRTGGGEAAAATFTAIGNKFLGGRCPRSLGHKIYDKYGSPDPVAPTWKRNALSPGTSLGDATDVGRTSGPSPGRAVFRT